MSISFPEIFDQPFLTSTLLLNVVFLFFRSNCDERVARKLRAHYGRPYFLPNLSENKNVDWIFMGSRGYGAQMHVGTCLFVSPLL